MTWTETCDSQVRLAIQFGRTKKGPKSKRKQPFNKSLSQPLEVPLTQQKTRRRRTRERRTRTNGSDETGFEHNFSMNEPLPTVKNTFVAL